MPVVQQIQTPKEFWEGIVVPDYEAFMANRDYLRLAFHCAVALFHMADWVFVTREATLPATFGFNAAGGERGFGNALVSIHPEFAPVRHAANAAKHLRLRKSRGHASDTAVKTTGWGEGGWGRRPWAVAVGQQDLEFSDVAKSVFTMWQTLNAQHRWW